MKKLYLMAFCTIVPLSLWGQRINFNEHIAPIIHQHCTPCHQLGEAAPFNLITYQDVAKRSNFIQKVTETRYMPPWRADPNFGQFKNVRRLTVGQIAMIRVWISQGMPEGEPEKLVSKPKIGKQSGLSADKVLAWQQAFTVPANNREGYYLFSLPCNFDEDTYIKGIEFVPGNKKLVHHARISVDTTQLLRATNGKSIDDTSIARYGTVKMKEEFIAGWVPGNNAVIYPNGMAKMLPKGSDLLVNVHYAPNNLPNQQDSSLVKLYIAQKPITNPVQTFILHEEHISNQPFEILPDTVVTFYAKTQELPYSISLLSVQPHMHVLGKSLRCYAITPGGDMIPLIKIPLWDFNWQMTYEYAQPLTIPIGSVLYAEATYDNTAQNPENYFNPPKKITYGWSTTQEMMNVIFQYIIP